MRTAYQNLRHLLKRVKGHPWFFTYVCGAALVVFCLFLYDGIGDCGFEHDDLFAMEMVHTRTSYVSFLLQPIGIHFSPMARVHISLMFTIFGQEEYRPYYHFLLALFVVLSFLFWRLVVALGGSEVTGFAAALLFCAHPYFNDALFWITGSGCIFANLWGILSILWMNRFLKSGNKAYYVAALLCYITCMETLEFGVIYLSFWFYCFFRRKSSEKIKRPMLYYFVIPLALSAMAKLYYLFFYYLPLYHVPHAGAELGTYRIAGMAKWGINARHYAVWLLDGLPRYLHIWPEFSNRYTPPDRATSDSLSLLVLFLLAFLLVFLWRRMTRLQIVGVLWTLTAIISISFFTLDPRFMSFGLPGFLMFFVPLLTEVPRLASKRLPRLRFVNLAVLLFFAVQFAASTEARKMFYIDCNRRQEAMRDQIVKKYENAGAGSLIVVAYSRRPHHSRTTGRMQEDSVGKYLARFLKDREIVVRAAPIDLATSVTELFRFRMVPPQTYSEMYFCLWDGKTARDVTNDVPTLDRYLPFEVDRENIISIDLRRPLEAASPIILDGKIPIGPGAIALTSGAHYLFLPPNLSNKEAVVRAVGREFSASEFAALYGGIIEHNRATLFIQNAKFEVPTSLTAKTEYAIGVEAQNPGIGEVILVLCGPDGKTELARYVFKRKDNSYSWLEKRITPDMDLDRICLTFVNDQRGPEGDLNASISRVRVIRLEPSEPVSRPNELAQEIQKATDTTVLSDLIAQARARMQKYEGFGFRNNARPLAEAVISALPQAAKTTEPLRLIEDGKALVEICRQIGYADGADSLTEVLIREFPGRKDLYWLRPSVKSVVVHQYNWMKDVAAIWGCRTTDRDTTWLKGDVEKHAIIFPRGHGKPFAADGSYALKFDLRVVAERPTPGGSAAVYLNTRSGQGPGGTDWGEFDAFGIPIDTTGEMNHLTIPLRSNVETAKFIHEIRIDPLAENVPCLFEIGNMRLEKLDSALAGSEPPPEGFLTFDVGKQNVVTFAAARPLTSPSLLLLDSSPLQQMNEMTLTTGTHLVTLPKGWATSDLAVHAVGREYSVREFENLRGGTVGQGAAQLFIQDAAFSVPTSMTARMEYAVSVEAQNSRVGAVVIALRGPDDKTELARYTFDQKDESLAWQERRLTPTVDMNRLTFAFMSDYTGPEGDLNAHVTRVRVMRAGPANGGK